MSWRRTTSLTPTATPVAAAAAVPAKKTEWGCATCTYMNKPDALKCEMCDSAKPPPEVAKGIKDLSWSCPACTFHNASGDKCSICATAKPEKEPEAKVKKDPRFKLQRLVEHQWVVGRMFEGFYMDKMFSDFTIIVIGANGIRVELPAHRIVIASWTEPLKHMVYGESKNDGKVEVKAPTAPTSATLTNVEPSMMEDFLYYLYTGRMQLSYGNLSAILALAHRWKLVELVEECLEWMGDSIEVDTVCKLAGVAAQYEQKELQERYFKFIYTNTDRVMATDGFFQLPEHVFISLISNDSLAAHEIDIFHAVIKWANYTSGSAATEGRKDRLPQLLHHVRFSQMKLKELMKVVKPTGLLPTDIIYLFAEAMADASLVATELKDYCLRPRDPPAVYRPATDQFADNTGIVYWIGTRDEKLPYTNPAEGASHEIKVSMSSTAGSAAHHVFDRSLTTNPAENSYGRERTPWMEFEFKNVRVRLESYFIAQDTDHFLRNWRIEGSQEGNGWVTLRQHTDDDTLSSANRHAFFAIPPSSTTVRGVLDPTTQYYKKLRIYLTGPSHSGETNFDITQVEFFGWVLREDQL